MGKSNEGNGRVNERRKGNFKVSFDILSTRLMDPFLSCEK